MEGDLDRDLERDLEGELEVSLGGGLKTGHVRGLAVKIRSHNIPAYR